jgi:hypothetical protein
LRWRSSPHKRLSVTLASPSFKTTFSPDLNSKIVRKSLI